MNHSLNYLARLNLIAEIMSSSMAKSLILQRSAFASHKKALAIALNLTKQQD